MSREKPITYKNFDIRITQDEDPESPREWDNMGRMICFHKRYTLGDKHDYDFQEYTSWSQLREAITRAENPAVILPLFLYDHSGLRIKIGSFSGHLPQGHAEFDSGQVGFILVSKEKLRAEFGVKKITQKILEHAKNNLQGEVEVYDQYLSGYVWCYSAEDRDDPDNTESCCGFYGYDECVSEAKSAVDSLLAHSPVANLP